MNLHQLISLLVQVLTSPAVIGVTIVIALYINIVNYIVRYRKQPPRIRKKILKAAPEPAPKKDEDGTDEDEEEEEKDEAKRRSRKGRK